MLGTQTIFAHQLNLMYGRMSYASNTANALKQGGAVREVPVGLARTLNARHSDAITQIL